MNKGMIGVFPAWLLLVLPLALAAEGEIYKVVDEHGNVTFTDQRPSDSAQPMDLPPLSVIQSEIQVAEPAAGDGEVAEAGQAPEAGQAQAPTPRDLRKQFGDFRITQPAQEETFWGTANTVVVAWGASQPPLPDMSARLYVDGTPQDVPAAGSLGMTLDRGEHKVYAELLDARNRRIVTSDTVTFFVHQHSVNFNGPAAAPRNSGP